MPRGSPPALSILAEAGVPVLPATLFAPPRVAAACHPRRIAFAYPDQPASQTFLIASHRFPGKVRLYPCPVRHKRRLHF